MSTKLLTTHWNCLDRERVRALQNRKLHHFLRDCVLPFSAHYQRVFREQGLRADDIRSIEKDELDREWRPTFMTATTGRSTESVSFLYSQRDLHNLAVGGGRIAEI